MGLVITDLAALIASTLLLGTHPGTQRLRIAPPNWPKTPSTMPGMHQISWVSLRTKGLTPPRIESHCPPDRVNETPAHERRGVGVADGTRTRDVLDHNQVLYQLNYSHHGVAVKATGRV